MGTQFLNVFGASRSATERPNIIFLLTDDQRWNTLGCMGNDIIQTPNLDDMAENRQRLAEEQRKSEIQHAQDRRLCDQAKARLASYQQPRVNVTEPDGTYRRLSEEERQAEITRSQHQVDELCK